MADRGTSHAARDCSVAVVGAGPAGLAAALELARLGTRDVLVLEREAEAGGTPRLCGHTGFGVRDLRWPRSGPQYARWYRERVIAAGVEVRSSSTVTGWAGPTRLTVSAPQGLSEIQADAVLLATGCFERSRAGRLVHGRRPQGVFTTGSLQRFVYQHGQSIGRSAVVVGAENVSLSALLTLRHVHGSAVALITEHEEAQIPALYTPARWYLVDLRRIPLVTRAHVQRILGQKRVEAVEIVHADSGREECLACDTVIFTGDWVVESELARLAGLELDSPTRGPRVDAGLRTSRAGVFAAGNLLRGALAADQAALEGRAAARHISRYLAQEGAWPERRVAVAAGRGVAWVSPSAVSSGHERPPLGYFAIQASKLLWEATVTVSQGERVLYQKGFSRLGPNQTATLGADWVDQVDLFGPDVEVDAE